MKKDRDSTVKKIEKEIVELQANDVLAKKSAIEEFKSSDDFQEVVEQATSKYFGEGFDLCKKKISILHPDLDILDIQIDPDLVDEDEEEEKNVTDTNLPQQFSSSQHFHVHFIFVISSPVMETLINEYFTS